jgi:hypothetical protein
MLAAVLVTSLPVLAGSFNAGFALGGPQTPTNTKIIAVGTELRVRLRNDLSSKRSRVGDRFTATVINPSRYEGATVSGHISDIDKSGRVKGRTSMTLAFDSIRLRNGRRGTMRGEVIKLYDGSSSTRVDEEGNVESGSRGKQTLKRSGIGAAAGAVVGGLIGGGKGVAAGLLIGGAAGAGSIAIEGSKELEIESGSEMLVRVTRR